jgi:hypothetical protein
MLDKAIEQARARTVARKFPARLADLGFQKERGQSCIRMVDGNVWQVGLQKFRHQAAFRVWMKFTPRGSEKAAVEIADKWTYRNSPAGRKFDFSIHRGDEAAEHCLQEIRDFVETVAIAWFESQKAPARHN